MSLSNEDRLKELSAKPIMEVVELVKMLEDEWGVSAAAPVAVASRILATCFASPITWTSGTIPSSSAESVSTDWEPIARIT